MQWLLSVVSSLRLDSVCNFPTCLFLPNRLCHISRCVSAQVPHGADDSLDMFFSLTRSPTKCVSNRSLQPFCASSAPVHRSIMSLSCAVGAAVRHACLRWLISPCVLFGCSRALCTSASLHPIKIVHPVHHRRRSKFWA